MPPLEIDESPWERSMREPESKLGADVAAGHDRGHGYGHHLHGM
jgi:hypothetical protein